MSLDGTGGGLKLSRRQFLLGGGLLALALTTKTADVVEWVMRTIDDGRTHRTFSPPTDKSAKPAEVIVWKSEIWDISLGSLPTTHTLRRALHLRTWDGMLWYNQADDILREYNPNIDRSKFRGKMGVSNKSKHILPDFSFPLVFPTLLDTFPQTIEQFLQKYPDFHSAISENRTIVIVMKTPEGKRALAVYDEGKLRLATHISSGLVSSPRRNPRTKKVEPGGQETPDGIYTINEKLIYRQSQAFDAPMPYAMNFLDGKFVHAGAVNGDKLSHACVRLPLAYMHAFHAIVQKDTPIVIALESVPKPSGIPMIASR